MDTYTLQPVPENLHQAEKQDRIKQAVSKIYKKQKYELQAIPQSSCLTCHAATLKTMLTFDKLGTYRRQLWKSKWTQSAKLENHVLQLGAIASRKEMCKIAKVKADIELEFMGAEIDNKFGPFEFGDFFSRTPGEKIRPAVPIFYDAHVCDPCRYK